MATEKDKKTDNQITASSDQIAYIEPNISVSLDDDKVLNGFEEAPKLEDYSIYVNLQVEVKSRYNVFDESKLYSVSWDGKSTAVSFQQGSRIYFDKYNKDSSNVPYANAFTTDYADFSYEDRKKNENVTPTSEMFGIKSIDINYDNYYVPQVTIEFVDIRGISLFSPEQDAHNFTQDGISGTRNPDYAGSFFKSFFSFPYPKFTLKVKGFYGKPIGYELNCTDWRATFDCSTGNFGCNATFIGYSYALLSDITFNLLCAAPLTVNGAQYWKDKKGIVYQNIINDSPSDGSADNLNNTNGYGIDDKDKENFVYADDGTPMCTFKTFIEEMNAAEVQASQYAESSDDAKQSQECNDKISIVNEMIQKLSTVKTQFEESATIKNVSILPNNGTDNGYEIMVIGSSYKLTEKTYNNVQNQLTKVLDDIRTSAQTYTDIITDGKVDGSVSNGFVSFDEFKKSKAYTEYTKTSKDKMKATNFFYYIEYVDLYNQLNGKLQENTDTQTTAQNSIANQQSIIYNSHINFKPCVQNVIKMICAHIDTLLELIDRTVNKVKEESKTRFLSKMNIQESDCPKDAEVPAFPKITTSITENGITKIQDGWIGDCIPNTPEENLVNELMSASKILATVATRIDNNGNAEGVDATNAANSTSIRPIMDYPIIPSDLLLSKDDKMFGEILTDKGQENLRNLMIRCLNICGTFKSINYQQIQTLARYDADNFYKLFPLNTSNFAKAVVNRTLWNGNLKSYLLSNMKTLLQNFVTYNNSTDTISYSIKINNNKYIVPFANYNLDKFWSSLNEINYKYISEKYSAALLSNINDKQQYYTIVNRCLNSKNKMPYGIDLVFPLKMEFNLEAMDSLCEKINKNNNLQNKDIINYVFYSYFTISDMNKISSEYDKIISMLKGDNEMTVIKSFRGIFAVYVGYRFKEYTSVKSLENTDYYFYNSYKDTKIIKTFVKKYDEFCEKYKQLNFDWKNYKNKKITGLTSSQSQSISKAGDNVRDKGTDAVYSAQVFAEKKAQLDNYHKNKQNADKFLLFIKEYEDEQMLLVKYQSSIKCDIDSSHTAHAKFGLLIPYLHAFTAELTKLYKSTDKQTDSDTGSGDANNVSTNEENKVKPVSDLAQIKEAKIALYNYLKIIYDRWLCGHTKSELLKWRLAEFYGKRFTYIDSFYYKIGQRAVLDPHDLYQRILDSLRQDGYSTVAFISEILSKNNMTFLCIQNFEDLSKKENVENAFKQYSYEDIDNTPPQSDFICLYTYEQSHTIGGNEEYEDSGNTTLGDSFLITGSTQQTGVPQVITSKTNENGYRIPCFGVSFGKQYQSFFQNIQVNMDSPVVTEQVIRTQYSLGNTAGSNKGLQCIGQDLFTIYSNNSYQCSVTMLGCGWIQPTMYFSLLNIPMFSGTYMIFKTTHHIEPGMFTTTFTGNRLSKIANPLISQWLIGGDGMSEGALEDKRHELAAIDNDCPYEHNDPDAMLLGTEAFNKCVGELKQYVNKMANMVEGECSGSANKTDSALLIVCVINRKLGGKIWGSTWDKVFNSINPGDNSEFTKKTATSETLNFMTNMLNNNSVLSFAKQAKGLNGDITKLTFIDSWNGKTLDSASDKKHNNRITSSKYYFEDVLSDGKHAQIFGNLAKNHNKPYWTNTNEGNLSAEEKKLDKKAVGLWRAIKATADNTPSLKDANLKLVTKYNDQLNFMIQCEGSTGAKVFDMISYTYLGETATLFWITKSNNNVKSPPTFIYLRAKKSKDAQLENIAFQNENNIGRSVLRNIKAENISDDLKKTIQKNMSGENVVQFKAKCNLLAPGELEKVTATITNCDTLLGVGSAVGAGFGVGGKCTTDNGMSNKIWNKYKVVGISKYSPVGNSPTNNKTPQRVTHDFLEPRSKGPHCGVDIDNTNGYNYVFAIANGTVIMDDGDCQTGGHGYGHVIVIRHDSIKDGNGNILYSLYGHMQPASRIKGNVTAGQCIGQIAHGGINEQCGESTGSHLHLSVYWNKPTNSVPFCHWVDPKGYILHT